MATAKVRTLLVFGSPKAGELAMRTEALAFWVREPRAGEIRPVPWLRRRLRGAAEQRRDAVRLVRDRRPDARVLAELV
jgi:hypothetical protein